MNVASRFLSPQLVISSLPMSDATPAWLLSRALRLLHLPVPPSRAVSQQPASQLQVLRLALLTLSSTHGLTAS